MLPLRTGNNVHFVESWVMVLASVKTPGVKDGPLENALEALSAPRVALLTFYNQTLIGSPWSCHFLLRVFGIFLH